MFRQKLLVNSDECEEGMWGGKCVTTGGGDDLQLILKPLRHLCKPPKAGLYPPGSHEPDGTLK